MAYDPDQMLRENRAFWHIFLKLTVATSAAVLLALILMALFLT